MKKNYQAALVCVCLFTLGACGGGGGGGGNGNTPASTRHTLSLSPSSLQLTITGDGPPAIAEVTATFSGAGIVVGTPPNQGLPPWLNVTAQQQQSSPAKLNVVANAAGLPTGTFVATLRVATGDSDQTNVTFVDLPVTLIHKAGFRISDNWDLNFLSYVGSSEPQPSEISVQIEGDDIRWEISSIPGWLEVTPQSGTAAGSVTLRARSDGLAPGTFEHLLQVRELNTGASLPLQVRHTVRVAQLKTSHADFNFSIDSDSTAAALSRTLTLSDDADGRAGADLSWTATTEASWLQISPTSGRTSPASELRAEIPTSALEQLAPGFHQGSIRIETVDPLGVTKTQSFLVTLNFHIPLVRAANPYLVAPGVPATVRIRGEGMHPDLFSRLRVGGSEPANIRQIVVVVRRDTRAQQCIGRRKACGDIRERTGLGAFERGHRRVRASERRVGRHSFGRPSWSLDL